MSEQTPSDKENKYYNGDQDDEKKGLMHAKTNQCEIH